MSLPIPALLLSLLAAPLAVSAQASRPQVVPTTMTVAAVGGAVTVTLDLPNSPIKPTGLANEGYVMGNTPVPLVCHSVCQTSQPYYAGCVLRQNIRSNPQGGPFPSLSSASSSSSADSNEGRFQNIPTQTCLEQLCQPASFNHLRECLNCIVANGGEREVTVSRPPGVTPHPTPWWPGSTEEERNEWPGEGWGRIEGVEEARGWLRNVTVFCSEKGQEVEGVEEEEGEGWGLTATPTTTGPYTIIHSQNATIDIPQWTELATLSEVVSEYHDRQHSAWASAMTSAVRASAERENAADRAGGRGLESWVVGGVAGVMGAMALILFQ